MLQRRTLPRAVRRGESWPRWLTYSLPGAWTALAFVCLSFTPSLVPRPGHFQGLVCGVNGAIGYGVGVVAAVVWREVADRDERAPRRWSWAVFWVTAAVALSVSFALGIHWQAEIRRLMDVERSGSGLQRVLVPVVAVPTFVLLVAAGRGLVVAYRRLAGLLGRWIGARAAKVLGLAGVAVVSATLVTGVLVDLTFDAADRTFQVRDTLVPDDAVQPTGPFRSGTPESLVAWDDLGREGRLFVGSGPSTTEIAELTGRPALDPIRSFAGVDAADTIEERAALAVRDLERAGGFERSHLLVVTTTGSGWVDAASINSFEYLTGGDSAAVAMQYSYLPSWISYLADQDDARAAGRELFDAVYEVWLQLPADARPRLYASGESLGSFGTEHAFSGEHDLANRLDGAVFAGPPNFNPLFRRFVDDRDAGSREVAPVHRGGRTVRFATGGRIFPSVDEQAWDGTRVLYLLNPSDPIVWWNSDLLHESPDWLQEQRGRDVLDDTRWIPFVTFWQVTVDLTVATGVPSGHGHRYSSEYVGAWATVLRSDLDKAQLDRIRDEVTEQDTTYASY